MAFALSTAFDYLQRAHAGGRLGHAYLLIGGEAAFGLAGRLAGSVVHADPARILEHPDVHLVEPESKSRRIVVEQMRELENVLRLRAAAAGGRKVGIVREADRLQVQASNAFLKTLEEPPAESLLLLVTALPESLPETILSRCIKVVLQEEASAAPADGPPEDAALLGLLARHARERPAAGGPAVAAGYLFLREFTQLLAAARARLQAEGDAALKREETQYAQTTDGSWLGEREAYHKGITEARYVAERGRLVETLARWWGDVLRLQTTAADPSVADPDRPGAASLAGRLPTSEVLRRLGRIEELRENLDRNIQEALALEVAFLQVFGA